MVNLELTLSETASPRWILTSRSSRSSSHLSWCIVCYQYLPKTTKVPIIPAQYQQCKLQTEAPAPCTSWPWLGAPPIGAPDQLERRLSYRTHQLEFSLANGVSNWNTNPFNRLLRMVEPAQHARPRQPHENDKLTMEVIHSVWFVRSFPHPQWWKKSRITNHQPCFWTPQTHQTSSKLLKTPIHPSCPHRSNFSTSDSSISFSRTSRSRPSRPSRPFR